MFVHVDISFQYLAAVADYVRVSGDAGWARAHWPGLAAAWRYCTAQIHDGLPRIPPGKEGQNEQDALSDDIRLSTLWIDAADGFARLAAATGHATEARAATAAATRARRALGATGWDAARDFWLSGHTPAGEPVHGARPDASGVLRQDVFAPAQVDRVLDRLSGPEFVTDWGIRSLSAADPAYDPNRYGSGSVWALGTAAVATTLWQAHRPLAALGLWRGLIAWNTLDSGGHLHEVLAGDLFHPEVESVPEQTWSSASVLTGTVGGLLGLAVRSGERAIDFAPHLPAAWPGVTLRNVAVGPTRLTLTLRRTADAVDLEVANPGAAVAIAFAPEVPLGATIGVATLDGAPTAVAAEPHADDRHLRAGFTAHPGVTRLHVALAGGVDVALPDAALLPGSASRAARIAGTGLTGRTLTITGWAGAPGSGVVVLSPWPLHGVDGAAARELAPGRYVVCFAGAPGERVAARLDFGDAGTGAAAAVGCDARASDQ